LGWGNAQNAAAKELDSVGLAVELAARLADFNQPHRVRFSGANRQDETKVFHDGPSSAQGAQQC
jgi:class 3 adenylate cyclase